MKACNTNLQINKFKNNSLKLMNKKLRKPISMANMSIKRNIKMEKWRARFKKKEQRNNSSSRYAKNGWVNH